MQELQIQAECRIIIFCLKPDAPLCNRPLSATEMSLSMVCANTEDSGSNLVICVVTDQDGVNQYASHLA